ncbi:carbon monoxide dehydrogenase [Burkholderia cenocepacia]|nr:carbon monoxide dehydrogenase [Burkholderia cenocepacia]
MKAVAFEYEAPSSLDAACTLLDRTSDGVKVMGGSQSMGPMLNMRLVRPTRVVDVSRLPELRTVQADGESVRIGAAVTHAEIEDGVFPELQGSMLQHVAANIAYRAVRNRGTLGGSLAHADPAADWVVICTVLGARLTLVSARGTRDVAMDDFMLGAYTTALQDGEVIATVTVPRESAASRWAYEKFCRKTGEFAEASCAAWFDSSRRTGRIVAGALDGAPQVLNELTVAFAAQGPGWIGTPAFEALLTDAARGAAPDRDAADQKLMCAVIRRTLAQFSAETKR